MHVLVTGGAGYIGSVSVEILLAAGHAVDVLDDLSMGHRAAVLPGATFHEGTYTDETAVPPAAVGSRHRRRVALRGAFTRRRIDADLARYYRQNVAGGVALLEALRAVGVRRIVFSSSAAVYGTPDESPVPEDAPLIRSIRTASRSGSSKSALSWYAAAYGLRSVSLRYFNAAGASAAQRRGSPARDPSSSPTCFVPPRGNAHGDGLRRRLPDARRDLRPGLHPR